MNTTTQYGLTYQGHPMASLTFVSREDVNEYVARAVAWGRAAEDYAVVQRDVTYGDWAPTTPAPAPLATVMMGNGAAVHLADTRGALCNRWGTVNGRWVAPKPVTAAATCKRCMRLAPAARA